MLKNIRSKVDFREFIEKVRKIVEDVKENGDQAVMKYEKIFDGVELRSLKVRKKEIEKAYEEVDDDFIDALEVAKENIERFHMLTSFERETKIEFEDCLMGKIYVPLERVGAYIPGGRASYPSTALMIGVPANIAGVEKLIACTPPNNEGKVNPLTLVSCDIAGFNEIYKIGGAQAIAAMAYGTESVPKVEKIVGPGNFFVTAAKIIVSNDVAIDMPAGPSEILIIADETANPEFIIYDCLAQLEHDPMAVAVVLTTSENIAKEVKNRVEKATVQIVKSLEEAIGIANEFAPEHLSIFCKNAINYLSKIKNAGSVFLGDFSAVAMGDYVSGTNHVLPTLGYAKVLSGLSVESFMKSFTFQQLSFETLKRLGKIAIKIANSEGLKYHAESIKIRLNYSKNS
ncbi:MAG: histidinol dehydrogenase [Archaeoglobaceae archaeon]|nr:histidinol dehydrogenase [Archaeoglobaceae archaeon]